MRAALYTRVSTKEQVAGYSLADQMRALREHAKERGYEIVAEIEDPGHSGGYLERPGIDRVRSLVAAGGVDIVLAQDADRITREPGDRSVLDLEAERRGCKWMGLDDWGDDSHEGQLLKFIKGWMAKGERSKIAERMQRGKRQRAREGKIVPAGRPPLGYEYAGDAYRVDKAAMVLVRRIFELSASGESLWRIKKPSRVKVSLLQAAPTKGHLGSGTRTRCVELSSGTNISATATRRSETSFLTAWLRDWTLTRATGFPDTIATTRAVPATNAAKGRRSRAPSG